MYISNLVVLVMLLMYFMWQGRIFLGGFKIYSAHISRLSTCHQTLGAKARPAGPYKDSVNFSLSYVEGFF